MMTTQSKRGSSSSEFTPRPAPQLSGRRLSAQDDPDDRPPSSGSREKKTMLRRQRSHRLSASDDVFAEEDELRKDQHALAIDPEAEPDEDEDEDVFAAQGSARKVSLGSGSAEAQKSSEPTLAPPSTTMDEYFEQLIEYINHDTTCDLTLEETTALARHSIDATTGRLATLLDLGLAQALTIGLERCLTMPAGQHWLAFAVWTLTQNADAAKQLYDASVHIPLIAALEQDATRETIPVLTIVLGALTSLCTSAKEQQLLLGASTPTAVAGAMRAYFNSASPRDVEFERRACCLIGFLADDNTAAQHDLHTVHAEQLCLKCLPEPTTATTTTGSSGKRPPRQQANKHQHKGKGKGKGKGKHNHNNHKQQHKQSHKANITSSNNSNNAQQKDTQRKDGYEPGSAAYEAHTCALFALAQLACDAETAQSMLEHQGFERCAALVTEATQDETRLDYTFQVLAALVKHATPDQLKSLALSQTTTCDVARAALWKTIRVLNTARVVLAYLSSNTVERWIQWTASLGTRWL